MYKERYKSGDALPARRAAASDFLLDSSDDDSTCVLSEEKLAHLLGPEQPLPNQPPGPRAIEVSAEEGGATNQQDGPLRVSEYLYQTLEEQGVKSDRNFVAETSPEVAARMTWRHSFSNNFRKDVYRLPILVVASLVAVSALFALINV